MTAAPAAGARRARVALYVDFFMLGLALAVWVSRLPTIKHDLALSNGALSLALLALPAGAIVAVRLAGRLTDRLGSARMTALGGGLSGLALIGPGLAGGLPTLIGTLLVCGAAQGAFDVGINTQATQVERAHGRPLMSSFHAAFSIGGLAGASLGGLTAHAGLSPATTFAAAGAVIMALVVGGMRALLSPADVPGVAVHPVDPTAGAAIGDPPAAASAGPAVAARARVSGGWVLMLGMLGIFCLVGEGAAGDWSAVYLRDNLGASVGVAPSAYAAFSIAMAAGRLAGDRLVAAFGPVRVVRCCGLLAAAGLGGALLARDPLWSAVGFGVFGAGLSSIVPQLFSAAGNADPARAGATIARVASLGYLGLVGGPVLIGGLAGLVGLRLALVVPVALAGLVSAAAGALGPGRSGPRPATQPSEERTTRARR